VLTEKARLANHNARPVIDEEAASNLGGRVNVDSSRDFLLFLGHLENDCGRHPCPLDESARRR
jgi:hypothetical protein